MEYTKDFEQTASVPRLYRRRVSASQAVSGGCNPPLTPMPGGFAGKPVKPARQLSNNLSALRASNWTSQFESMCVVRQCSVHGPSPIPQEGAYGKLTDCSQISAFSHGVGTCAPQQGGCKLTLNVKNGVIREALIEVIGCSGMTQSAAMAAEILPGRTLTEALNTDLVCDAINVAMREIFLQFVYGRSQTAFSKGGLPVGAGLEDLGKGMRSQVGTSYGSLEKGPRYLELAEGYVSKLGLDEQNRIIGYEFVDLGRMMKLITVDRLAPAEALTSATGTYGRFAEAVRTINPREE